MNYLVSDYTFWGLFSGDGKPVDTPITSIAYIVALVDTAQNPIVNLDKAKFILRYLFEVEEQVKSASELLSIQSKSFPAGFYPQTPVMLALKWSPISALLEQGWDPTFLSRESHGMACASGIWGAKTVENAKLFEKCGTQEELFWHALGRAVEKADERDLLLNIIAKPGWSYASNIDRPRNITLAEARKADRVIWQRTPRP